MPTGRKGRPDIRLPDIHVLPANCEEHEASKDCFCCPAVCQDMRTGRQVVTHVSREEAN